MDPYTELHPLDPLTEEEILVVRGVVKAKCLQEIVGKYVFNSISLLEPEKDLMLAVLNEAVAIADEKTANTAFVVERKALVILIEKPSGQVWEAVVNVTKREVERLQQVAAGLQPTLTPEDCFDAERIAKDDAQVQLKFKELGYDDVDLLVADPWSIGYCPDEPEFENRRLVQLFMYAREFPGDNHYAHPLNFVVVVDINTEKVVRIEDLPTGTDFGTDSATRTIVPRKPWNYDPDILGKDHLRHDLKPIHITCPEGPSFSVDGNLVCWQKFSFRIGFNYREGLVLHDVRYKDGNKLRPLFYRLSLSEMVVPYGDPRPPFHRKSAFDVGDYGLGFCANSLTLGCDCVGEIKYFDAVLNDHDGNPTVIKNAVCMHEEDAGLLWKHTEYRTGKVASARGRKLVVSFIVTVVNYEYAFYWSFSQDGTISFEVKATGELSTNLIQEDLGSSPYGTVVAPSILAQNHQHIFAMRIDPMIDGKRNTVSVVDVEPLAHSPGPEPNPHGQGFVVYKRPVASSSECTSEVEPKLNRTWHIANEHVLNPMNNLPTAWKLVPSATSYGQLMAQPGSVICSRAGFARKQLWVTKYKHGLDLYAAGFYVNQSKGGDGLPKLVNSGEDGKDENLRNEDVLLWHVFGVTHIPRVEDFPVMNVESCGFSLKPCNFFTANPALDVPPSTKEATKSKLACCPKSLAG